MDSLMKKPSEMLDYACEVAEKKAHTKTLKTLLLAYIGGIFIATGAYTSSVASYAIENPSVAKLVQAAVFPIGLILIVICGGEIFTGNCLIFFGVLDKKVRIPELLKNLLLIFIGNIFGTFTICAIIYFGKMLDGGEFSVYVIKVAATKANLDVFSIFLRGIFCNIVVCIAIWGSYAAKEVTGKFLMCYLTVLAFVLTGTEHCVANMYYFWIGMFASFDADALAHAVEKYPFVENFNLINVIKNMIPATIANFVGAAVFISSIYYYLFKEKKA